jgi:hypothetical protein
MDPGTLRVYLRELDDIPLAVLEQTVRELIRTSEFFPTVRAIREAAAERTLNLPGEEEALAQIEARIRWAREDEETRGDPPSVHPLVVRALEHVGGFHGYRSADEPGVVRGQFLRLYRDLRGRAIHDAKVGAIEIEPGQERRALGPAGS